MGECQFFVSLSIHNISIRSWQISHTLMSSLSAGIPAVVVAVSVSTSLLFLLLLFILLLCFFIQRRAKRRREEEATIDDENPVYGDYFDLAPRMEVEDSNDYYSSDYEAGTGTSKTTDTNSYYE